MQPDPSRPAPARRTMLLCVLGMLGLAAPVLLPTSAAAAQESCEVPGTAELPSRPWQLELLNPRSVWHLSRGAGVTVAVIDSGVSATHEMLDGQVLPGRDFGGLEDEDGRCDLNGHGTIVAATIAGRELPGVTIHGVAPDATILPGRVLAGQNIDSVEASIRFAEAITWAVDAGADVINLSVQGAATPELEHAVEYAAGEDVVLVAAAGNVNQEGLQAPGFPAAYPQVIAVGGISADGGHVESSQIAGYVDVAAPGAGVYGPAPGGGYLYREAGTSYAAPYVSGVAALIRAHYPELSAPEVAERILLTADRPPEGRNDQVGHGVVNPYRALTTVLGSRPNQPVAVPVPPSEPDDPLASARRVAPWATLGAVALAGILLALPPTIRRGRRRRWRPARHV